jgi:glutamate decarboxylase
MVLLSSVTETQDALSPIVEGIENFKFELQDEPDAVASVYGSHYAAMDLPKYEMPEKEMPKEVAYRLIK